jgi:hypothetical protein
VPHARDFSARELRRLLVEAAATETARPLAYVAAAGPSSREATALPVGDVVGIAAELRDP